MCCGREDKVFWATETGTVGAVDVHRPEHALWTVADRACAINDLLELDGGGLMSCGRSHGAAIALWDPRRKGALVQQYHKRSVLGDASAPVPHQSMQTSYLNFGLMYFVLQFADRATVNPRASMERCVPRNSRRSRMWWPWAPQTGNSISGTSENNNTFHQCICRRRQVRAKHSSHDIQCPTITHDLVPSSTGPVP